MACAGAASPVSVEGSRARSTNRALWRGAASWEWQAAMESLILVAESGGPMMFGAHRSHAGLRPAPGHLPRHLLFAIIAYRIQADRFGDLAHETRHVLDRT